MLWIVDDCSNVVKPRINHPQFGIPIIGIIPVWDDVLSDPQSWSVFMGWFVALALPHEWDNPKNYIHGI
jgi:hypothetical protein